MYYHRRATGHRLLVGAQHILALDGSRPTEWAGGKKQSMHLTAAFWSRCGILGHCCYDPRGMDPVTMMRIKRVHGQESGGFLTRGSKEQFSPRPTEKLPTSFQMRMTHDQHTALGWPPLPLLCCCAQTRRGSYPTPCRPPSRPTAHPPAPSPPCGKHGHCSPTLGSASAVMAGKYGSGKY